MSHLHTTNWVSSLALQQSQTRTHVHVCGHTHAQTQRTIWASECQNYSCCADSPTGYHLSYIRSQLLGLWVTFQCHSGDPEINTKKLTILLQIKSLGNYYAAESPSKFMENVLVYTQGHYYQLMAGGNAHVELSSSCVPCFLPYHLNFVRSIPSGREYYEKVKLKWELLLLLCQGNQLQTEVYLLFT